MDKNKFESVLILIVPDIVKLIAQKHNWDEITASNNFYTSAVYENLEDEATKLWHLSPYALFNMFEEEQENGKFEFPEET